MFWKLYGMMLVMCAVVPGVLVLMGFVYGQQRAAEYAMRNVMSLQQMDRRNVAYTELQSAKGYLEYLVGSGLAAEPASAKYEELRTAFLEERYEEVQSDVVLTEVAKVEQADEVAMRQANVEVETLAQEVTDAKKLGVKTEEVQKSLDGMSEMILARRYEEVKQGVSDQRTALKKVVEEKKKADEEARKKALAGVAPVVAMQSNGGISYERKGVQTPNGTFTTDVLRVDLSRAWARTFVAHDGDCSRDCAVKPLAAYVGENGGVAGINGSYFCPPDYAHCAEKKNSFDLLVFDYRTKKYSNSGNNQYSTNPLINFYPGRANLYGQALGFGRDTGASGVISNFPLLINNGTIVGSNTGKGTRGAIGFNGSVVWAVQVRSASFQDTAFVLQALGANNAMNLDGGGSSALYFGGYKVGPGRALPNAVVFGN